MGSEVLISRAPATVKRVMLRRVLWIGSNLTVGYYAALIPAIIEAVWADERSTADLTMVLLVAFCTAVAIGAMALVGGVMNAGIRSFSLDIPVRWYWALSAAMFFGWSGYFWLTVALTRGEWYPRLWF